MYLLLVLLSATVALAVPNVHFELEKAEELFEEFIVTYGKNYQSPEEKAFRLEVFKETLKRVNALNAKHPLAEFGIHSHSDLTMEELKKLRTGFINGPITIDCAFEEVTSAGEAPESLDWRDHNVVTEVKNQLECGSCWAFSTIANVESQYALKHKKLVALSEQELLDCDKADHACYGGLTSVALSSLIKIGGVMSEEDYKYEAKKMNCTYDAKKAVAKVTNCTFYFFQNEEYIKSVLHEKGPLSVGIYAEDIVAYMGGILENCDDYAADHAVLLVGYGNENGFPYWILKNSWGTKWGEKGYIRLAMGENACGLGHNEITSCTVE